MNYYYFEQQVPPHQEEKSEELPSRLPLKRFVYDVYAARGYTPPKEAPHRPGADDHYKYTHKGYPC